MNHEINSLPDRIREARLALLARCSKRPRTALPAVTRPFIVSLTTYGERLKLVHFAIETLLRQTVQPMRLILWIDDSVEDREISMALRRQSYRGLEIRRAPNLGPHTKIIHALQEFPDQPILTVDDDVQYPPNLFARLYDAFAAEPLHIHCCRAHKVHLSSTGEIKHYKDWEWETECTGPSSFLFPTGNGGVLYPPGSLHPEVTNIALFQSLCPQADDVWLKAMALLAESKAKKLPGKYRQFPTTRHSQKQSLSQSNVLDGGNDVQIRKVFAHYNLNALLQTQT